MDQKDWISVKDRLPMSETYDECLDGFVLVHAQGQTVIPCVAGFRISSKDHSVIEWFLPEDESKWFVPTHWMPLPPPPVVAPE